MNDKSFGTIGEWLDYYRENPLAYFRDYNKELKLSDVIPSSGFYNVSVGKGRTFGKTAKQKERTDIIVAHRNAPGRAVKFTNVPVYGELPPDFPVTWEERAEAGIIEANKKSSPYTGAMFAQEQGKD